MAIVPLLHRKGDIFMQPESKKSSLLPKILIGVVILGLAIGIGFYVFINFFTKPGDKIILAAAKTVEGNQLAHTATKARELSDGKKLGINIKGDITIDGSSFTIDGAINTDVEAKECSATGNFAAGGQAVDFGVFINDSTINFSLPSLFSSKLIYDYTQVPTGYIKSLESEMEGVTFADINEVLASSWDNPGNQAEFNANLLLKAREQINSLEWEKTEKKSCEFQNKTVDAAGYKASVTSTELAEWIRAYNALYTDYINKTFGSGLTNLMNKQGANPTAAFEQFAQEVEELNTTFNIEVYMANKQLVDLIVEAEGTTIEAAIKGGSYPLENVDVILPDGTISLVGTTNGSKETVKLVYDGFTAGSYDYDSQTGAYSVTGPEGPITSGTLIREGDGLKFTVDSLTIDGESYDCSLTCDMTGTPVINKDAATGTDFLLNTATEEDIQKLVMEIIYGNMF